MTRILALPVLVLAAAVVVPAAAAMDARPVAVATAPKFGKIAVTAKHLALSTWRKEPAGTVRCTGSCAATWPPLTVAAHTTVAKHMAGLLGAVGTIVRPDGRTQATLNGHPLYACHAGTPTKILCNGVDGWFVVKA